MAKKNEVVLTFAGDSRDLERATAQSGDALKKLQDDVDRSAESMRGLDRAIGQGGRSFGDYGTGLGGLGDRADEVDTRMMGLSDGIQGVSDLMRAEQLAPHELAMAFSDLGSSAYNTVIPSLQSVTGGVKGMAERIKSSGGVLAALQRNMTGIGVAAGGAAVAAAGAAILWQSYTDTQAEAKKRTEELTDAIEAEARGTKDAVDQAVRRKLAEGDVGRILADNAANYDVLTEGLRTQARAAEELDNSLGPIIAGGRTAAEVFERAGIESSAYTDELIRLIDNSDLTAGETKELIDALDGESDRLQDAAQATEQYTAATDGTAEAQERVAEAIRGTSDAIQAQADPVFAMIDAQQRVADAAAGVADAEAAVTEAVNEFGEGSTEHEEALAALHEAQLAVAESGLAMESKLHDLAAAMVEEGFQVDDIIAHLQGMVGQNGITQESVNAVADSIRAVPDADPIITAHDHATWTITDIKNKLDTLPDQHTIAIRGFLTSLPGNLGRKVEEFFDTPGAAIGGTRSGMTLVGEHGPELVDLPNGSYIHPAHTSAAMMGGAAGGIVNHFYIQGSIRSDRELIKLIRDEFERGGFRGLVR